METCQVAGVGRPEVRPRGKVCFPEGGMRGARVAPICLPASPEVGNVSNCLVCSPQGGCPLDPEGLQENLQGSRSQGDPSPSTGSTCPGPINSLSGPWLRVRMGAGEDSPVTSLPTGGQDRRQVPRGAGPHPHLPQVQLAEAGPAGRHRALCTPGCHGRQWLLGPLRENVSERPGRPPPSPLTSEGSSV